MSYDPLMRVTAIAVKFIQSAMLIDNQALIKALGRGHFWQHLLDTGAVADTAEIAKREGIHRATVSELLRLTLLAPDIVQAAFEGKLPRTMSLESLLRTTFPLDWGKQREMIAGLGRSI